MNVRRVVGLGLLLGLLLNLVGLLANGIFLREAWAEAIPVRPAFAIRGWHGWFLSMASDFVFGPALVWLYAAIQPRFGPGFQTAMRAAMIIWILGVAVPYVGILRIGWLPNGIAGATSAVAFLSFVPAAWLTARFYDESPRPRR